MATAGGAVSAARFWQRMAIGLAAFIVFGFLQAAARGFVDPLSAPAWVHVHALAMLAWLALLVVQPALVARKNLGLHRRLGWLGAGSRSSSRGLVFSAASWPWCCIASRLSSIPPISLRSLRSNRWCSARWWSGRSGSAARPTGTGD